MELEKCVWIKPKIHRKEERNKDKAEIEELENR